MSSELNPEAVCCYCGSTRLVQTHDGLHHPFKRDHGPFKFHRCSTCGSGLTLHPPTRDQLSSLYGSFRDGLSNLHRDITEDDPQNALYSLCVRRVRRIAGQAGKGLRSWIDVGAGGGELSRIIAQALPEATGLAVDLHERPASLGFPKQITWKRVDLNDGNFSDAIGTTAQLVISTAVWEHVLSPDKFVNNLLRLLEPGGLLYLLAPDYGSLARRLMGRRWPYFTPGEHLNIATADGANKCLARQWQAVHGGTSAPIIQSRPLRLPYTLRYVFRRFGMNEIGRLLPPGLSLPLPVGALESVLLPPANMARA